jgi:adenosylcobyric acid synthase
MDKWMTYEIHMGVTKLIDLDRINSRLIKPLLKVEGDRKDQNLGIHDEGMQCDRVWGSYLHGLFESAHVRKALTQLANINEHQVTSVSWIEHQQNLYNNMADLLEMYLDLSQIRCYLDI